MSYCLIEGLHLLGLEVADDGVDPTQQLVDERHHLAHLEGTIETGQEQVLKILIKLPEPGRIVFCI